MNFLNWLPLALALIGAGVTAVNALRLRRAGINAFALETGDDTSGFLGRAFTAISALYAIILLAIALWPVRAPQILGGVPALMHVPFFWLGILLMAGGIGLLALGQHEMGTAWRIGIAAATPPILVTGGLFARCRNPIFLGMLIAAAGVALAAPNALSFAAFAATYLGLSLHIRLEEAYLRSWLGKTYEDYAAKVPRWLPNLGAGR